MSGAEYLALDMIWDAQSLGLLQEEGRPTQLPKGVCPFCEKQIGKGLHRHKLACRKKRS